MKQALPHVTVSFPDLLEAVWPLPLLVLVAIVPLLLRVSLLVRRGLQSAGLKGHVCSLGVEVGQRDHVNQNSNPVCVKKKFNILSVVEQFVNEHEQPVPLRPILTLQGEEAEWSHDHHMTMTSLSHDCHMLTDLLQFPDHEGRVIERPYLIVALTIHYGHGLQTHGLHGGLGREEESVVEVVEELLPVDRRGREGGREGRRGEGEREGGRGEERERGGEGEGGREKWKSRREQREGEREGRDRE